MMFRPLTRRKQELSKEECIEVLNSTLRGVLSLLGDEGYPYGVPLNHFYNEEDGCLYFHSGKKGHKIDALTNYDKASYCVYDEGFVKEGEWALNIRSVIVFGRIEIVEDLKEIEDICRKLSYKFTSDSEYIENEISRSLKNTLMFRLKIEHLCGKLVNES